MTLFQQLPLSRFVVDRAAHLRAGDDNLFEGARTLVLVVHDHSVPVTDDLSLMWVKPNALNLDAQSFAKNGVLLGADENHDFFAIVNEAATVAPVAWAHLREVGAQLSAHDVGLAVTAVAMSQWHATHTHCPRCGGTTRVVQLGWARMCDADQSEHYPRTEPAMIVAVNDAAGRILLGRRAGWQEGWFSTLAGFVEAGESAEACVLREVKEESGIDLDPETMRYLGSQPWPYPASLMLGYRVQAITCEIAHDEQEMAQVQWFTREEFEADCASGALRLPEIGRAHV